MCQTDCYIRAKHDSTAMANININGRYKRSKPRLTCNIVFAALFLLIVTVSVVLTVLTLRINRLQGLSIHHTHYGTFSVELRQEAEKIATSDFKTLNNSAPRQIYRYNYTKINYKNVLKPPYLPMEKRKPGWKVLSGNVVVHEGHVDNPHNYSYVINSAETCSDQAFNVSLITALIFVESNVENIERRRLIRETWGLPMLQRSYNVKIVFMLGVSTSNRTRENVTREFYTYGDTVQETFEETFKHLTLKTVMGLKWAQTYCRQADFVIKTDDDILIHLPNLIKLLQAYGKNAKKLLLCHQNHSRRIERMGIVYAKYRVSPFELPGSFFPEYCSGFTYIMSRDVVVALYAASTSTPYFFIEDVYVTGFCRHKAGIELVDDSRIVLRPYITSDSAPCDFSEGRITSQELELDETQGIWTAVNTRGFFCPVLISDLSFINHKKQRLKNVSRT